IAAATSAPGGVATLIVPADCQWESCTGPAAPARPAGWTTVADDPVAEAAELVAKGAGTILLLGGRALRRQGLLAAARIAQATGCRLMSEMFPARLERGAGLPAPERIGYFPEQAAGQFATASAIVLAGA